MLVLWMVTVRMDGSVIVGWRMVCMVVEPVPVAVPVPFPTEGIVVCAAGVYNIGPQVVELAYICRHWPSTQYSPWTAHQ